MIKHEKQVLFTENELRCRGTKTLKLAKGFAEALKELRVAFEKPMIVNSCCRAPSHNERVGGHYRSLHLTEGGHNTGGTCAIDIGTREQSSEYRTELVHLALGLGWSVGIHPGFIHLDLRSKYTKLPQNIFNY